MAAGHDVKSINDNYAELTIAAGHDVLNFNMREYYLYGFEY